LAAGSNPGGYYQVGKTCTAKTGPENFSIEIEKLVSQTESDAE
jgi:hypothetical protein